MGYSLSTGDLSELLGVPNNTLDNWCRKGWLKPTSNVEGRGHHRRFDVMDLLACAYALDFIHMGYSSEVAFRIVAYFDSLNEEELLEEFKKGHTYLLPMPGMALTEPPCEGLESLCIERLYHKCKAALAEAIKQKKKRTRGRKRGLAESVAEDQETRKPKPRRR